MTAVTLALVPCLLVRFKSHLSNLSTVYFLLSRRKDSVADEKETKDYFIKLKRNKCY